VKQIRVLIADDHPLIRSGIRALLENARDIEIVAEAENGAEALKLAAEYKPDVVLMDIKMPELDGLEVTARMHEEFPEVRVIILSVHVEEEYVRRALRCGATGYLTKSARSVELELAIRAVAKGQTFIDLPLAVAEILRSDGKGPSLGSLTRRQREIFQLIVEGHSIKGIAMSLNLSVKTVETHRAQLMERLSIHDTAGLVRYALKAGLIKLED
jgi:DNA-binding NarL/FixJ family response regulator